MKGLNLKKYQKMLVFFLFVFEKQTQTHKGEEKMLLNYKTLIKKNIKN